MGFMDSIKERFGNKSKAQDLARQHSDKIDDGIDRGGHMADERTGGKHSDQIGKGTDRAKDSMGKYTSEGGDDTR
ncbi:antitoxin [Streptantibioticus silvisoli]|uniref:Antitoxin n=1 Tax=Streptantibioticus silvisoli TaxID=2705255 RepID=A0ABT6W6N8_9ACTN|nr:antitoxin [Streptantibioticus silvisoli]MDI5966413.1 antitoxin [Streptantibioticus silvisoli]